jgi:hypothetical protein
VFCFVGWRGHTVLIDNHDVAGLPKAPDMITVSVDGQEASEYLNGDRDRAKVAGIKHKIRIAWEDGSRDPFTAEFSLPIKSDMYLLSIPKLLAGQNAVEVFNQAPQAPAPSQQDEEIDTTGHIDM